MTAHRLVALLEDAAQGRFPAADGEIEVLPPPPGAAMAVVAFTAHHVIAADIDESWVREQLPAGDLRAPMSPRFLHGLGTRLGRGDDGVDVVLAAPGLAGSSALVAGDRGEHPRATRAHSFREDVRVFEGADGAAVVILGRGLGLRLEVAIEIDPARRGRGVGMRMLIEARRLVGAHDVLYAQVAPGNAASLRTFLRAGFEPIGCEVLFL